MKIGFYYHIPAIQLPDGRISTTGYLGVFLDSLAAESAHLFLFLHQPTAVEKKDMDYILQQDNVSLVELGIKTPAWHRMLLPGKYKKQFVKYGQHCDHVIVRGPSPLAPFIFSFLKPHTNVVFLIVGDYLHGIKFLGGNPVRKLGITGLLYVNRILQNRATKRAKVFVNSRALYESHKALAKEIHEVKTTTLSKKDFFEQEDRCTKPPIKILYAGRLDFAKGLMEATEAIGKMREKGHPLEFHLVGWEADGGTQVQDAMVAKAKTLNPEADFLVFHGKKNVGVELLEVYRQSDIFLIASYHEGFPRVIWEALASSLPVVATKVGSIPHFLVDKKHALLIESHSVAAIEQAVSTLIENKEVRQGLIKSGFKLVQNFTLEKQTRILIEML